jgi:hypothetical protein
MLLLQGHVLSLQKMRILLSFKGNFSPHLFIYFTKMVLTTFIVRNMIKPSPSKVHEWCKHLETCKNAPQLVNVEAKQEVLARRHQGTPMTRFHPDKFASKLWFVSSCQHDVEVSGAAVTPSNKRKFGCTEGDIDDEGPASACCTNHNGE